jgi:oligopeptide/dipeptide ABC transporter ATP-binding protein
VGENILEVKNLKTYFHTEEGIIKAVDDVTFSVEKGKTLGIVGESGCGKSITSYSIMQLVPHPGIIENGEIIYNSNNKKVNLLDFSPHSKEMRKVRGNDIAMIFQEPMTSLNPIFTIGNQIREAIHLHQDLNEKEEKNRAVEVLKHVGISAPEKRVNEYPHQLSGGMKQRVMIAMALTCKPNLLIADEPTTALDVTIETQILKLMNDIQKELKMSIILITHDLGVIGEMADYIIVMYTGKIVEKINKRNLFNNPKHPYTQGLIDSIPTIGKKERLKSIKGTVPNLTNLPSGCYFSPRCPYKMDKCEKKQPPLFEIGDCQGVRCWLYEEEEL